MKAIMVMFDSLNLRFLEPYGGGAQTENFRRLAQRTAQFDNCYAGSLPCMPARRELQTGRCNFLHRSWGPMEPYDDSMPALLDRAGVHTRLVSDHGHYWEDGGATYHTRYSTWENFRGQEGDRWKGVVGGVEDRDPNLIEFDGYRGLLYRQDVVNRSYLQDERDHPQVRTFDAGLEFIETNHAADDWFLQIETFDPHEPFFSYQRYKDLYPHDYDGPRFDWPDYAPVSQTPDQVREARYAYQALLTMCDRQLGRVLDEMDRLDLWKDTMLIVNTDHGYMLGEHGFWAKNYMPCYNEIAHLPLFIWDPRCPGAKGVRRESLVQTIDLPATLLEFFGAPVPADCCGRPLRDTVARDEPVRDAALFGIFGAHVCCTDGRYVYMRAPVSGDNAPLYEYTLMPTHMAGFFSPEELRTMEVREPFSFTKGTPLMRFAAQPGLRCIEKRDLLFDLQADPQQQMPIEDAEVEEKMKKLLVRLMRENDAPEEQFVRLGL